MQVDVSAPTPRAVKNEIKRRQLAEKKAAAEALKEQLHDAHKHVDPTSKTNEHTHGPADDQRPDGSATAGPDRERRDQRDERRDVPRQKAQVNVTNRHLDEMIADAWQAELDRPIEESSLFVRDGELVRLMPRRHGVQITPVSQNAQLNRLVDIARWVKLTPKPGEMVTGQAIEVEWVEKPAKPPDKVPGMMLAAPHPKLPQLDAVVSTPVFGASGDLIMRPGYYAADGLWYARGGLVVPDVPLAPSRADLARAKALIDEMIVDFIFATESDKTHVVALLVLPFVRRLIKGPTPLHLIDAPGPAAGKSLLAGAVSIVGLGRQVEATTLGKDEEETRKKITTLLMKGSQVVLFDNLREGIDSATLAAVLTSDVWSDRLLGTMSDVSVPNRAAWVATANNPKVTTEIARRCARIRLMVNVEKPQDRTGFRHPRLLEWVASSRPDLVWSVLILVRWWQAEGSPLGKGTFGSYESWAGVVGGILECAGYPGFLESSKGLFDLADTEGAEWRAFVAAWHAHLGNGVVLAEDLRALATRHNLLGAVVRADLIDQSQRAKLGAALVKMRDRVFDIGEDSKTTVKLEVSKDKKTKANVYRLLVVAVGGE